MILYIEKHPEIKTIAVFEVSRLGRSFKDSIDTFLELEKNGRMVYSLSEEWTHVRDKNVRPILMAIMS